MTGERVSIDCGNGRSFGAYLARPESGRGPGIVVIPEIFGLNDHIRSICDLYAEEGYFAIAPDIFWRIQPALELGYDESGLTRARELAKRCDVDLALGDIAATIVTLRALPGAAGKLGIVGFCFGGRLAFLTAARMQVDVAISYYGDGIEEYDNDLREVRCPLMLHWGAQDSEISPSVREKLRAALAGHDQVQTYVYVEAGHGFNCDQRQSFHRFSARLAHSRTLGILQWTIGPHYDLGDLWENHLAGEFSTRDVDATMATMVSQPYVNHIPTLTGGVGYAELRHFYATHFIPRLPADIRVMPVTRTISPNRVIDEFVVCFTHDREVDFMAPGLPATGRYVEVPHVAVVEFRGNKIAHEHIHWDHASFLKQIGVLDTNGLPIAGSEGAAKLVDEKLPANELMLRMKSSKA